MTGLASELRHKVVIQTKVAGGRDEDGYNLPNAWTTYKNLWAKVTPVAARDLVLTQTELTEITARLNICYIFVFISIMRVLWKDKIYSIVSEGLDDNVDGYTYTTFNLSSGVENG